MSTIYALFALVGSIAAIVCGIIILIDAFQDSVLKGLFCILCGIYMLYYAFVDFEHENKLLIILGWLFGGAIGAGFGAMLR